MNYKKILPEIVVGLGDKTEFDKNQNIIKLHLEIENWLGDDLLWSFPETIVTERLKKDLENNIFTGFLFEDFLVTKDIYFDDNYHLKIPLPKFYWMKINGIEEKNDFYMKANELFISEKSLTYINDNYSLNNAEIEPTKALLHDFILELLEKDKKKLDDSNKK